MNATIANQVILPACFALLPAGMDCPEARAMVLSICLQESDFIHRVQLIGNHRRWWESLNGPARGFAQFEIIGIEGVLDHPASGAMALALLDKLGYPDHPQTIHRAMAHNDILMAAFTRLALWRLPQPLPERFDTDEGYRQYLESWRPGRARPERWGFRYAEAWRIVDSAT